MNPKEEKEDSAIKKKYIATLIGTGIGDTLGMPVEGWKKEQIERYERNITEPTVQSYIYDDSRSLIKEDEYGKIKYYTISLKKGQYTDDTLLTIALAKSIAEVGAPSLEYIANEQLITYKKTLANHGTPQRGFGKSTIEALENYEKTRDPYNSGVNLGPGNGPVMKIAPIGIYMDATGEFETGIKFAKLIAKTTHQDPRSIVGAAIQANNIYTLLHDTSKNLFIKSAIEICEEHEEELDSKNGKKDKFPGSKEGSMLSRLKWIKNNMDAPSKEAYKQLKNSSKVYESFPFAMFMFQKYWDRPIEGILKTVNYGGDADTTGAIFGALVGAKHGMIFPKEWVEILEDHDVLEDLGEKLYQLRTR